MMPKNPNVNINQFALPGMEKHAHGGAQFLAEGGKFHKSTDYTYSDGGHGARRPYSHVLFAFGKRGQTVGEMHWAGSAQEKQGMKGHYPGEIEWVNRPTPRTKANPTGRDYISDKNGNWKRPPRQHKGVVTGMLKMAHELEPGRDTIPVHSSERTREGEAWATKVGPAELTPKRYDENWRPPAGIHPFERNKERAGSPRQMEGQQPLPGMEAHSDERKVDLGHVLKNWIK